MYNLGKLGLLGHRKGREQISFKSRFHHTDIVIPSVRRTGIYLLVQDLQCGIFSVKIGMSCNPYQRYLTMLPAIAFPSVMKWAMVGRKKKACKLERSLHKRFKERNSAREWFVFSSDDKNLLWETVAQEFISSAGRPPDWWVITEENIAEYSRFRPPAIEKDAF